MSWFTRPLPGRPTAAEYGHAAEGFDFPNAVALDSVAYPDFTGPDGGPEAHRAVTGETFQATNPEYAGAYALGYLDAPGAPVSAAFLAPAPGSVDLSAARDAGAVPGTNRLIHSEGPVTGSPFVGWTGTRTDLHKPIAQVDGPVTGGPDYGRTLTAAYYGQAQAAYSQAAAEAAMVAAL